MIFCARYNHIFRTRGKTHNVLKVASGISVGIVSDLFAQKSIIYLFGSLHIKGRRARGIRDYNFDIRRTNGFAGVDNNSL